MNRQDRRRAGHYARPFMTPPDAPRCVHDGEPCLVTSLGQMIAFQEANPLPGLDAPLFEARAGLPLGAMMSLCSFCGCLTVAGAAHGSHVA